MNDEQSFICPGCKKMFLNTAIDNFDHVRQCNGPNPDSPIGITWFKWPPSPNKKTSPVQTIGPYFIKKRPVTRA